MTNLPEAILTLIKESASPIDTFTGVVEKIAIDLLGEDFILDTYLEKASLEDINNAQWCWQKEASQKLTRNELLEFVLMEDFPEFLKKASWEVGEVLRNIQGILKEGSTKKLALDVKAKLGDPLAIAPHVLKYERGAATPKTIDILSKAGMAGGITSLVNKSSRSSLGAGGSMGSMLGGGGTKALGSTLPKTPGMRSMGSMGSRGAGTGRGGPGTASGASVGY